MQEQVLQDALETSPEALPDSTREAMEARFGHSFDRVRIHTDARAAEATSALGANALTVGPDILFGADQFHPDSPPGQRLLAHELAHVVQQRDAEPGPGVGVPSRPGDPAEREASTVADRLHAGNPVEVRETAPRGIYGDWLDTLGDVFGARYNEAEIDEYEDAQDELKEFRSHDHSTTNFQSTTRLGMFDATYSPGRGLLRVTCKCRFEFIPGSATEFPSAQPEELTWTDQEEMKKFKSGFISVVSGAWTAALHTFYCQKDWWESLSATTTVDIKEVAAGEHFLLKISKIPPNAFRTSKVKRPKVQREGGQETVTPGVGQFDSEDLNPVAKPGGTQVPAVHEAGHMLGLDDEYETGSTNAPSHSPLVAAEHGHGVARGPDGRVMSGGSSITPEHGVTFLAALKRATGMDQWSTARKAPRPEPVREAPGMGDYPQPPTDRVPV